MIRFYAKEKWKELKFPKMIKFRYAISNHGRMVSFSDKIQNGTLIRGSNVRGYMVFSHSKMVKGEKVYKKWYVHRLVAETFLKQKSKKHEYVIHLDWRHNNNVVGNLKWVTREEMVEHNKKSPRVIAARKKLEQFNRERDGHKLTVKKAIQLKKKIADPKRKTSFKVIAKQFGISEMQLYRIKSGENWGHLKI